MKGLLLVVSALMLSAIVLADSSSDEIAQLDKQMKNLLGRMRLYKKCLKRNCSDQERQAAARSIMKDGFYLVATVGTIAAASWILPKFVGKFKSKTVFKPVAKEEEIHFDRERIKPDKRGRYMEGYWAWSSDKEKDIHKGYYPFPKQNSKSWPGESEFLAKLALIEQETGRGRIERIPWYGIGDRYHSRFDETAELGLDEFYDRDANVGWTMDFGRHYVEKYHIIPSRQFYRYVINYELDG